MWYFRQFAITFLLIFASAFLQARSAKVNSPLQSVKKASVSHVSSASPCQDFLSSWGQKPEPLKSIDCQNVSTPQGEGLMASYTAKGVDAAAVEALLKRKFRMAPLQFVEGIWQPVFSDEKGQLKPGSGEFVDDLGNWFEIIMTSEKTTLNRRQDWHKLERFQVVVIQHLEAMQ